MRAAYSHLKDTRERLPSEAIHSYILSYHGLQDVVVGGDILVKPSYSLSETLSDMFSIPATYRISRGSLQQKVTCACKRVASITTKVIPNRKYYRLVHDLMTYQRDDVDTCQLSWVAVILASAWDIREVGTSTNIHIFNLPKM